MEVNEISTSRATRVVDILEQIDRLNDMLEMHGSRSDGQFMVHQYTDMKQRFLAELKELLAGYDIEVKVTEKAA